MPGSCCKSNKTRIIKIGGVETGVIDLDQILMDVYLLGLENEKEIESELLKRAKEKNYIPESREVYYSIALMSEYRKLLEEKEPSISKSPDTKIIKTEHQKYSIGHKIKRKLQRFFT